MKLGSNVGVLRVGSTAVAAIKRGTDRVYDADVAAFQKASAAADVSGIMDLVDYLKTESLWNYARFYPMKSSQNAGTGSTVYGLGGLTSNNMTLVNSPTWGSDGVTFEKASSHYGAISDFLSTTTGDLSVFARISHSSPLSTAAETVVAQWQTSGSYSFLYMFRGDAAGDPYRIVRSADGTSIGAYDDDGSDANSDERVVVFQSLGADRKLFINKTEKSLSLVATFTPQAGLFNSNAGISVGSASPDSPSALFGGSMACVSFIETTLTTTQRETITDLINAL